MKKTMIFRWHSYLGVVIGFFILLSALSGSLIAFYHTLDEKINPWQVSFPSHGSKPSDPLSHIEQVEARVNGGKVAWISLSLSHQSSWHYFLSPTYNRQSILNNEVYVDPYTEQIKGMRLWGNITQGISNLMPFIYKVHYSLSLGSIGVLVMGSVALAWCILLICGFLLTFPKGNGAFFTQWKKSWKWRFNGSFRAKNHQLHTTIGLWLLPFFIVIAWSSFALNLHELHERLLSTTMHFQTAHEKIKELKKPQILPKIEWMKAREIGRNLMHELSIKEGFVINEESALMYDALKGIYIYSVRSSRDIKKDHGETSVYFDGNSGIQKASFIPSGTASGDTLTQWLTGLHKGSILGLPHRMVLSFFGVVITVFVLSGFYMWRKRKKAEVTRKENKYL